MTDKELIKLAARAAGIERPGGEHSRYDDGRIWDCDGLRWWNPLTDNGDALRLAVRLRIDVQHWDEPERISAEHPDLPINSITLEVEDDAMTICRRAIVRAAAEIGRNMP